MNSNAPFNANQDWTLAPYCQNNSNDQLVDKLIGNAYQVVRAVYANLGNLSNLYNFLNTLGMVVGVRTEEELKALSALVKYARVYEKKPDDTYEVTDYLYLFDDNSGIKPNDPLLTGSWVKIKSPVIITPGSGSGGYIPVVYKNGSATGGETYIKAPDDTVDVPFLIINGDMQTNGYQFEYNHEDSIATLAQPLEEGDFVVMLCSGLPASPDNPNVSDWVTINWLYNHGSAVGGEQVIDIPYNFQSVPAIYVNGARYYKDLSSKSYTIDPTNKRIFLTEPLSVNDRLIVQLGGEANVLESTDRTIQEVARSVNAQDSEIILSINLTDSLNGKKFLYSASEQKTYHLPTLPSNVHISTVVGNQLTYVPGNVTVTMHTVEEEIKEETKEEIKEEIEGRFAGNEQSILELNTWKDYQENLSINRSHKYKVLHEIPHQFVGYSTVVTDGGYNYLYATGHTFDHKANELWIAYQADGGDAAQFYVVYDLTTMIQKVYFKCGVRWTKTFNLHYTGNQRLLYGRGSDSNLAVFDVTTLPANGGTVAQYLQPKSKIGALFASIMGGQLLAAHRGQTTNNVTQFNTYLVLDPITFEHKRVYRLNTVAAGDTDGFSAFLYKTQGLCFTPSGVALAHGGFVGDTESVTKDVTVDFRSIQGIILRSPEGVSQNAGTFDPFKAMTLLSGLGYTVNRFETEGINYDEVTQRITTLWHIDGSSNSKFLIVEAFSAHDDALDLSSCAVSLLPNVPEVMSLYRNDQNSTSPHDPVTGLSMPDVTDLIQMMIRYDQRELIWYTSNFSAMTFNGATVLNSCFARLVRGTNTTFMLNLRNTGVNQEWVIQVSGSTYTYTRLNTIALDYRFEGTASGDLIGNGSPEGVVTASVGSSYRNRLGGAGTTLYIKESGTGNTGWVAK